MAPPRRAAAWGLIALMAIGSIAMWIGAPAFWLFLASRSTHSLQPSMKPYLMVIVGIPATMIAISRALVRLDRRYGELTGVEEVRFRAPWLKSMRAERGRGRRTSVLDVVMVISVGAALLVMLLWFLLFAGSSLPGS